MSHFTKEQHQEYGGMLQSVRRALMDVHIAVCSAYPNNGPECEASRAALDAANQLRNVLDDAVHDEDGFGVSGPIYKDYYGREEPH